MRWGSTWKGERRLKSSKDQTIAHQIQVRSREERILRMAKGVPSFLYLRLYIYTRAGSSQRPPAWREPFTAIPSIGACLPGVWPGLRSYHRYGDVLRLFKPIGRRG